MRWQAAGECAGGRCQSSGLIKRGWRQLSASIQVGRQRLMQVTIGSYEYEGEPRGERGQEDGRI